MCMSKKMAVELSEVIGKVEKVDTDVAGECFESFLRMRILVDITKSLKKLTKLD